MFSYLSSAGGVQHHDGAKEVGGIRATLAASPGDAGVIVGPAGNVVELTCSNCFKKASFDKDDLEDFGSLPCSACRTQVYPPIVVADGSPPRRKQGAGPSVRVAAAPIVVAESPPRQPSPASALSEVADKTTGACRPSCLPSKSGCAMPSLASVLSGAVRGSAEGDPKESVEDPKEAAEDGQAASGAGAKDTARTTPHPSLGR